MSFNRQFFQFEVVGEIHAQRSCSRRSTRNVSRTAASIRAARSPVIGVAGAAGVLPSSTTTRTTNS